MQAYSGKHTARNQQHQCSTGEPQVQAKDEQRVEHGRDHGGQQCHQHGAAGVAHRAQQRRAGHAHAQQHRGGQGDEQEAMRQFQHPAFGAQQAQRRVQEQQVQAREQQRQQHHPGHGRAGQRPGLIHLAGTDAPRERGHHADHHANVDRQMKEAHHPGKADGGGNGLFTQQRDVEQVDEVDRKNGHQPDGAGSRHDGNVPHQ